MSKAFLRRRWALFLTAALLALDSRAQIEVTNVRQIQLLATPAPAALYSIHLEGDVWWINGAEGKLVWHDDSGATELELDLQGQSVAAGQRVRLEGNGTITATGARLQLGVIGAVVDNDGVHGMNVKSGAVYLTEGRNPIRVEWFNGVDKSGLTVEYEGPGIPRQKIPDQVLFRPQVDSASHATNWIRGLEFRSCDAPGNVLPDFDRSPVRKAGVVNTFDVGVAARLEHIGICFSGAIAVPRPGLYTFYTSSDDGSRLLAGAPALRLTVIGSATYPETRRITLGQAVRPGEEGQWSEVEGKVTFVSDQGHGVKLELASGAGRMLVDVADGTTLSSSVLLNHRIRAMGFCRAALTTDAQAVLGDVLVPGAGQILVLDPRLDPPEYSEINPGNLPLLVNAAEVHRLKREEAQRGYPAKIRGIVTSLLPEHQAFTLQDDSRGIYIVDLAEHRSGPPEIGEFLEIEGNAGALYFAPIVNAHRVTSLGHGALPDPVRPTWDQLMNGSLDAQYVEIQGILSAVQSNAVILLTRDGRIQCDLRVNGMKTEDLVRYEDALVRVRGCLFATWDYVTHEVKVGEIKINGGEIAVDQPAPADLFSTLPKTAAELRLFDPQASVFQRVKVSGQIIHVRDTECFMMDRNNGVRFVVKKPGDLVAGDMVDVVGFPELGSASPILREAVARKTGHAALPPPREPASDRLVRADYDSTRIRLQALLVNQRTTAAGQALEMRVGLRTFLAWLPAEDDSARQIPAGSKLELTGTYVSQGGNRAARQDVASFELLLNTPADINILARPPWWTLERLLVILGALACVLAATVLWITQLRRKVDQRTTELEVQIRERQRVQQQHALEQERARIAQDLHDDLGSGLTEISMLGARARFTSAPNEKRGRYLELMGEKSRQMVTALDEIVWAMNPTHDSLASMVSYFSLYADRFLGLANIAWRFDGPMAPTDHVLDSRHRHQLFLAFKESLNNVVRHSQATEVRLNIQMLDNQVRLTVADNGRGLPENGRTDEMDGVANMRSRLEKLGGRFEVDSNPGHGTVVRFYIPSN